MAECMKGCIEGYTEAVQSLRNYIEESLMNKKRLVFAMDGKSASGKSTLAEKLAKEYGANLYHMDDFFLRPEQRTTERLSEAGGNVDYERFKEEVVNPLIEGREFSYGIFDCKEQRITEQRRAGQAQLHIIEGAYSMHPYFGKYYDLSVCLDIEPELQTERIRMRNGEQMLTRFIEEWIPKENAYLEQFHIMEQADIYIKCNEE